MSIDPRLKLLDRIKLQLVGHVYIGEVESESWKGPLPHYLFKCPLHGYVSSYPAGHDEKLMCPICMEEEARRTVNDTVNASTAVTAD